MLNFCIGMHHLPIKHLTKYLKEVTHERSELIGFYIFLGRKYSSTLKKLKIPKKLKGIFVFCEKKTQAT